MIKTVKKIGILQGEYPKALDIFEFTPPFEHPQFLCEYLTGAYYGETLYPQVALFASDEKGKIYFHDYPIIHEEGIPKYQELFRRLGYTLI